MNEATRANLTNKEFSKYVIQDAETAKRFDDLIDQQEEFEKKEAQLERRIEVLNEQLYFARELIGAIKYELTQPGNKGELRKSIEMQMEDSFFEL